MPKRTSITTVDYLINATLPEATDTYTVIPHGDVINKVRELLNEKGYSIERELYRCNEGASVAQGVYHLKNSNDPDMGMLFAWSNSYDKSMKFKCSMGGYVHASLASIIGGNMHKFTRKHTGTADTETFDAIKEQIDGGDQYFKDLVADKELMKTIPLTADVRAALMGRLYFVHELVTGEQMSIIRGEFNKPSFVYTGIADSVWSMYNAIIFALQKAHPRTWMDQQSMVHYFLTEFINTPSAVAVVSDEEELNGETVEEILDIEKAPTNQVDLEDMIKEVVAENPELNPIIEPGIKQPEVGEIFAKEADTVITVENPEVKQEEATEEEVNHELHGVDNNNVEMTVENKTAIEAALEEEEEVLTATAEVDEESWPCLNCGNMQPSTAVFNDGQLCTSCFDDLPF